MSQKSIESVAPIDMKNPLLASRVTGVLGIKKNKGMNIVTRRVINESFLKKSTFFDSIDL